MLNMYKRVQRTKPRYTRFQYHCIKKYYAIKKSKKELISKVRYNSCDTKQDTSIPCEIAFRMDSEEDKELANFNIDQFLEQRADAVTSNHTGVLQRDGQSSPITLSDSETVVFPGELRAPERISEANSGQPWYEELKKLGLRRRIIHDIVECADSVAYNSLIQAIRLIRRDTGFVFVVHHKLATFEHFHVLHDCNYTCGRCRCSFLGSLPIKKRSSKNIQYVADSGNRYIDNLVYYFDEDGYTYIKIIVEGVDREHPSGPKGNRLQ